LIIRDKAVDNIYNPIVRIFITLGKPGKKTPFDEK